MWTLVIAQDVLCVPRVHLFFWTRREPFISLLPVPKAGLRQIFHETPWRYFTPGNLNYEALLGRMY